jgi:hypothetical protein
MTLSILTGSYLFWINNYILWFVVTIMYKRDLWSIEYKSAIIPRLIYGNLRLFCVLEIKYNRFSYIDVFRFVNALWCEGWGSWRCASRCINYFFRMYHDVSRCSHLQSLNLINRMYHIASRIHDVPLAFKSCLEMWLWFF